MTYAWKLLYNQLSVYIIYTALMYMDPWIYDQLPLHIRQVVGTFVLASFYLPSAFLISSVSTIS